MPIYKIIYENQKHEQFEDELEINFDDQLHDVFNELYPEYSLVYYESIFNY